ncbi:hypothetical protein HBF26_05020 [Luteibacter jiangsuensis]|uniref:LemA protein n=1 Tax=Luteibacter jiangsuensis TaxID=637577 RepID=A0ABX0Q3C0_9GAMM|nr:hypothetical protein [Luteibacter jiangsuensis]NID04236.1 hypothetical protein [Luteibacter jiangsuensis]
MEVWICRVDWPGAISVFKDVVVAIAAGVTAVVAARGFSRWRAEDQGKADFDLARRALKALFTYKLEFARARSPVLWVAELIVSPGDDDHETKAKALARAYGRRLEPLRAAAVNLETIQTEVEGLWGAEAGKAVQRVLRTYVVLTSSIDAVIANARSGGEDFRADRDFGREMRENVSASGTPEPRNPSSGRHNSSLSQEIEDAVHGCAIVLRSKLPRP